jgi:hypothetical protein
LDRLQVWSLFRGNYFVPVKFYSPSSFHISTFFQNELYFSNQLPSNKHC